MKRNDIILGIVGLVIVPIALWFMVTAFLLLSQ